MSYKQPEPLKAIDRLLSLQLNNDAELQEIVELVSELLNAPVAFIILANQEKRYFNHKAATGKTANISKETLYQYLPGTTELLIVNDTQTDEQFVNAPFVVNSPHIRFYAAMPLVTHYSDKPGCLCLMDVRPRRLNKTQRHLLKVLAKQAALLMEFDLSIQLLKTQILQTKDAEIKLRSFFESSGACHLLIGKKMEVIAFNKNMAEFIERIYHISLYPGIAVAKVLSGIELQRFADEYESALQGNVIKYEREVTYRAEVIWWSITIEPGYNPEGDIIGISYNASDITQPKLHEQQIMAQNESLKKIAYLHSHELRRPLASILGLIEIFKSGDYDTTREELVMMEKAANELDDMIRNIVRYSELKMEAD